MVEEGGESQTYEKNCLRKHICKRIFYAFALDVKLENSRTFPKAEMSNVKFVH